MALKDGDFVKIECSMWRGSDNSLVRTTDQKLAEKNGILNKEVTYAPQLVVVGRDNTIKGIMDVMRTMDLGQSKKFDIKPTDAFGERMPELVRVMPIAEFRKREIEPVPGMQLDLDGAVATIKSVNSGRVMIDINHPLAGETLVCELKIVEKITPEPDKVKAVFGHFQLVPAKVDVTSNSAKVTFDSKIKKDARYLVDRSTAIDLAFRYMDNLQKITLEEEYERGTEAPLKA